MGEPVPDGPNQGHRITRQEVDILLDEYYAMRGWDANGIPTAETLRQFGLEEVAAGMESWACQREV
jgi:aldehyde:ferredoxin oxidoreductase